MSPQTRILRSERPDGKWSALPLLCFLLALFCLAYPIYVIRPFRHQGAAELRVALQVLRFRPIAMGIAAAIAAIAAAQCWRARRVWWHRTLAVLAAVAVLAFAGLSRINVYELMFHPAGGPGFAPVAETKLDGAEKVLAVRIGNEARAYPIRSISYHHVVNDRVGGVPIVATY